MRAQQARQAAIAVVDAAYRPQSDRAAWLDGLLRAASPALDLGMGLLAFSYRLENGRVRLAQPLIERDLKHAETVKPLFVQISEGLPASNVKESFAHPQTLEAASASIKRVHPDLPLEQSAGGYFAPLRPLGIVDCVACKATDVTGTGTGLLIAAPSKNYRQVSKASSARWTRVMLHALAAMRLYETLEAAGDQVGEGDAILDPGGRVLHADGGAKALTAREALRAAACNMDRSRSQAGRQDPDAALEAWKALVSGRWSLVDRFDSDGRRFLVARRNDPAVTGPNPLSRRERQILAYAAFGHANKEIAYALGLAPSTVSKHLRRAMRRVGANNVSDISRIFAANQASRER